jgi:RecA/RadA recombinase
MDFIKDIVKEIGDEYTSLASEIDESEEYIDTGSYIFNALCSGSIFGGISNKRITAIAGESSTGKTFFSLSVVKHFLTTNEDAYVLYFDTESAITKKLLSEKGIPLDRIVVINVVTVEDFRAKTLKAVDIYLKKKESDRKPCLFVLDSLGMLSTNKEIEDTLAEKTTRDMTKASLIKGAFRMLTLKLGQAKIPMIVTNHVYQEVGAYVPTKTMGGGSGLKYAASTIISLSKSKEKEGTEVIGNIIKAKTDKSRLTKEQKSVQIRLFYDERGLDRYYGLIEIAEKYNIFKKIGTRYDVDGTMVFEKSIYKNPEKYFTEDILNKIDEFAKLEFGYGRKDTTDSSEKSSDE